MGFWLFNPPAYAGGYGGDLGLDSFCSHRGNAVENLTLACGRRRQAGGHHREP